jgi:hypothetical protein
MPARFIISRLSIIGFAPKFVVEAGPHRTPKTWIYSIHKTGIPLGSGPRHAIAKYALAPVSHRQGLSQFMLSGTLRCSNPGTDWNWRIASMVRQEKETPAARGDRGF